MVLLELVVAATICFAGYAVGAEWMQVHEARGVVVVLRLFGVDGVSGALPRHILIFGPDGAVLNAAVTASCSSILSIVGLTALTVTVFRRRRQHAIAGLAVAVTALVLLNGIRLAASAIAGIWWGRPAMILFHDWVGSLWNLAATFAGFLVLVAVTLPAPERAEQDASGRHTARRPSSWARPGLGYQVPETDADPRRGGRGLTGFVYRYILPRRVADHLGARREAGRIDYRIGHMSPGERTARVRELVSDGLGAHTASLLAVATYDRDPEVLDTLAAEVAARQWEPVTTHRVASLRLWARGWMMSRGLPPRDADVDASVSATVALEAVAGSGGGDVAADAAGGPAPSGDGDEDQPTRSIADVVAMLRLTGPGWSSPTGGPLPITPPSVPRTGRAVAVPGRPTPPTFARPRRTGHGAASEDVR